MPNTKNFGYSTVLTAPSPASSGTSLVVQSADGAKFPAVPFNATVWPASAQALSSNAEIVTVTGISTDTLTIVRQAESTSARSIIVGDQIDASITAGLFPTGTVVGTSDVQTLTNKTLSDTVLASNFMSQSATLRDITLTASTNFSYRGVLEIGSGFVLEIPATSTLEVDGGVISSDLPSGAVVQVKNFLSSDFSTGSTVLPNDDTIPQNTEGDQYMTLAFTPQLATNILVIEVVALLSSSIAPAVMGVALFQDSTANALAAVATTMVSSTLAPVTIPLRHTMVAGTILTTTFKIRAGAHGAGTTTFNGFNSGRIYGGITKSSIIITEYKP